MFLIIFRRGTLNLKTSQDAIPPPFDVCWGIVGGHGRVPKTSAVSLLWFWRSTSFSACSRKKRKICEIWTCSGHISATWAATIFSKAACYREWKTEKLFPTSKKKLPYKFLSTWYTPLIVRFVLSARARARARPALRNWGLRPLSTRGTGEFQERALGTFSCYHSMLGNEKSRENKFGCGLKNFHDFLMHFKFGFEHKSTIEMVRCSKLAR